MPDPRAYIAGSSSLVLGADSYTMPTELEDREYSFSQNAVCRGGILQTRPGTRTLFCLPDGNFQGSTLFTPDNGVAQIVAAVDGKIYVSAAPFTSYRQLRNLQFSPTAKYLAWAVGLKSTDYDLDGNLVSLANPYSVLVMQDGLTRAAYWDGGTSAHMNPSLSSDITDVTDSTDTAPGLAGTPVGLWMIWSGNRLWVSRGNQVFASDIGNPLKFTEALYLNEARAFYLSGPCTGFIATPDQQGIIAFTETDGTFFQSNIQDRTQWLTTPDFQKLILPNIGCVAPRSLTTQYGLNWWFGPRGFTNLNAAFRQNLSSRIDYQDNQMFASKAYLGPDLSNICASFYENYLMVSVPSGDVLNRHTWVLDQAPFEGNVNAWTGIWTGWRPIEWARGIVNGSERVFFGSIDYDGKNRIWEAMLPERKDNGCRITCYAQLRDHAAGDLEDKRYEWSKFYLSQILGEVDLNVYVASTKGAYQFQKGYHIVANEGQIFSDVEYSEAGPFMIGNRVQSRQIRTPADPNDNECNACGVESKEGNMIDYAFSHLLVWSGQMGIRAYQMYMRESPDRNTGDCEEAEVAPRTLNAQGCSGLELLVDGQVFESFTAYAEGTATTRQGLSVYIRRTSVSYISQVAAQADAECAVEQTVAQLQGSDVECGVYDSVAAEIGSGTYVVVECAPAGDDGCCPEITAEPASTEVGIGEDAEFTVGVECGELATYQWQYFDGDWLDITDGATVCGGLASGATTATLTLTGVDSASGTEFRVVVSAANCDDVTSDPATLTIESAVDAQLLIVGAGGGAAVGGGGGGQVIAVASEAIDATVTYPIVLGVAGTGAVASVAGIKGGTGGTTTAFGYSALGGGGGGNTGNNGNQNGLNGAAGGGGGAWDGGTTNGGTGSPGGNGGGNAGRVASPYPGGGGGGASGAGANSPAASTGGNGGTGTSSSISGAALGYGGGGGGGVYSGGTGGTGMDGGGSAPGAAGQRGGGGGGTSNGSTGGAGSTGHVVVRYAGAALFTGGTVTTVAGDTVHTFTSSGSLAPI
jgi:hypothetical protein